MNWSQGGGNWKIWALKLIHEGGDMLKVKGFGLLVLFFAQSVGSSHYLEAKNCFTDVDVKIPVSLDKTGQGNGISEDDFNLILDEVEEVYTPVFKALGKTFEVRRLWTGKKIVDGRLIDGDTVNAFALQKGDLWYIQMFGGFARHKHGTLDSFRGIICHEIGHHLGGAPQGSDWWGSWASIEGQSDYFATSKCMKKLLLEGQKMGLEMKAPDFSKYEQAEIDEVALKCLGSFTPDENLVKGEEDSYSACERAALAGLSLGKMLGSLRNVNKKISLRTPTSYAVAKTFESHPKPQCRADTYFAGALCNLDFNLDLDDTDANIGACNRADGFDYGLRPLCWYKPKR